MDSRVEKAQKNAKLINKMMEGDSRPLFTRYDDGRPDNLFNKEGIVISSVVTVVEFHSKAGEIQYIFASQ